MGRITFPHAAILCTEVTCKEQKTAIFLPAAQLSPVWDELYSNKIKTFHKDELTILTVIRDWYWWKFYWHFIMCYMPSYIIDYLVDHYAAEVSTRSSLWDSLAAATPASFLLCGCTKNTDVTAISAFPHSPELSIFLPFSFPSLYCNTGGRGGTL